MELRPDRAGVLRSNAHPTRPFSAPSHILKAFKNLSSRIDPAPVHTRLRARPAVLRHAENTPPEACHKPLDQNLVVPLQRLHHGSRAIFLNETRRTARAVQTDAVLVTYTVASGCAACLGRPVAEQGA